jgi:hypothetical protein
MWIVNGSTVPRHWIIWSAAVPSGVWTVSGNPATFWRMVVLDWRSPASTRDPNVTNRISSPKPRRPYNLDNVLWGQQSLIDGEWAAHDVAKALIIATGPVRIYLTPWPITWSLQVASNARDHGDDCKIISVLMNIIEYEGVFLISLETNWGHSVGVSNNGK